MTTFADFIKRNTVKPAGMLPLVHTTRALHLKRIKESNEIVKSWCDVFQEDLNYFFVGRPAYKHRPGQEQAAYWELPACFIMEFDAVADVRRVYPFDTGAHADGRMPGFIQIIDRKEYEVVGVPDAPQRIIGAFFKSASDYFRLEVKERKQFDTEFSLSVWDAEIKALHMLAASAEISAMDDRRLCVELQSGASVPLINNKLLAIVCPSIYLDDPDFRNHIERVWNAEPISYNMQPLSYQHYIGQIYERVQSFYVQRKILPP